MVETDSSRPERTDGAEPQGRIPRISAEEGEGVVGDTTDPSG
jgi:hypothetical protein